MVRLKPVHNATSDLFSMMANVLKSVTNAEIGMLLQVPAQLVMMDGN